MSKQQTIRSFFQSSERSAEKRLSGDDGCKKSENISKKRGKEADSNTENTSPNKDHNNESSPVDTNESSYTNIKKAKLDKSTEHKVEDAILTDSIKERVHSVQVQKQIAQLELSGTLSSGIGCTWFEALEEEFKKPYFKSLDGFLQKV